MKLLTQWAVTSSALILIVLAVRYLFRDRLSARLRYALWGVVLLRLLVPFQIELPAAASGVLPVLASNFAPEVADMELYALRTQSTPLMEESLQAMKDYGHKAGDVIAYETNIHYIGSREVEGGTHCFVLSETSVDKYFFYTTLPKFLMTLWVIGAVWVALTIFRSNRYFFGRLKYYRHELEGVEAPIPVYTAANLSSPCLFGVLRPAVYLNPGAADDPTALRHILAHELTHYAHKDHLWSLLRCLVLALHWYNPLVWLAVALSKGDGELACDEGAVARLGEAERIPYGRTLVDMVAARSLRPGDLLSCSTAMTGGKKSIQQRVARLVKHPETVKTAVFGAAAVLVLAAVFVFAGRGEQKLDLYGPYRYQVGRTQAVRYSPSLISSQFYPDAITDPDLLEKALDILDHAADLLNTPEELGLDLSDAPFLSPRVTLLEDPDGSGHTYLLYTAHALNGDRCYLVTPAEMGAKSYAVAAVLDPSASGALESLARQQNYRNREDLTPASYDYNIYHNRLYAAKGIWLDMPMLHDGRVLTDPEQLEQVKELLTLTPIPRGGPLEWDGDWTHIIAFSLTSPDPDWTVTDASEAYYIQATDESFYYVCSGSNQEGGYYIGTISNENWDRAQEILRNAPSVDDRKHEAQDAMLGDLTPEQVTQINEAFRPDVELPDGSYGPSEISCFFTSNYDTPAQIDLEEFLRYCPLAEGVDELEEQEEYRKVLEASFWAEEVSDLDGFLLPTPMWRYPREKVSALLRKYAGVTVDELDWPNCLYLEEYDAFYNFTSDYGPGVFHCAGGEIREDTVLLWSVPDGNGDRCELALRKSGENWLIQSHHTTYER